MKKSSPLDSLFRVAALLAILAYGTPTAPGATGDPPKTHVLFMGADLAVEVDGKICPVHQVSGSYWVVEKDGAETRIPTRNGNFTLKVAPSLKLTENTATLGGYAATVGYSPKNDPSTRLTHALDDAAASNIGRETAVTQAELANMHQAAVTQQVASTSGLASQHMVGAYAYENKSYESAAANAALQQANEGDMTDGEPTGEIDSPGKDAVDVTFAATTDREIDDAYIVTVAKFRAHGDKPGVYRNLIYARDIGTIDANRRTISVNETGFPPGFVLLDFQLHLYHAGQEFATNISTKRVELTRDEAFEYVIAEYVGANGGKSAPAEPAMGHLPADFRSRLAAGKYREPIFVRVGKDGIPAEAYSNRDCSRRIEDPYVDRVVKGLLFKPALEKGKPVDSVASVRLDQLKI
jgi:hypothetical protein